MGLIKSLTAYNILEIGNQDQGSAQNRREGRVQWAVAPGGKIK